MIAALADTRFSEDLEATAHIAVNVKSTAGSAVGAITEAVACSSEVWEPANRMQTIVRGAMMGAAHAPTIETTAEVTEAAAVNGIRCQTNAPRRVKSPAKRAVNYSSTRNKRVGREPRVPIPPGAVPTQPAWAPTVPAVQIRRLASARY